MKRLFATMIMGILCLSMFSVPALTPDRAQATTTYQVGFTESGVANSQYVWSVALIGCGTESSNGPGNNIYTIIFNNVPSGTWPFTVTPPSGFLVQNPNGNVVVPGSPVQVNFALPPQVSISANPISGYVPLKVSFTSLVLGGFSPYSYSWSFGTGDTSTQANPSYTYTSQGTFTIKLAVIDSQSNTASTQASITVSSPASTGNLQVKVHSQSGNPVAGATVTMTSAPSGQNLESSTTDSSGQYTFPNVLTGSYSVSVTASGYQSGSGSTTVSAGQTGLITVTLSTTPPLSASASANPTSGVAPLNVQFTGSASNGQSPYSYSWSFGDGSSSNQQNPSHTYQTYGTYTAELTVTDNQGNTAVSSPITITVTIAPPSFQFMVSTTGTQFTVNVGELLDVPVSVTLVSGAPQQVSLSVAWIPTGSNQWFTTSFSPSSGDPSFASVLSITASDGTPSGTYTAQIFASGGGNVESTTVTVAVNPPLEVVGCSTSPLYPVEGQSFTVYLDVKNLGNSALPSPGYLMASANPGTDPQGQTPYIDGGLAASTNPTTISPNQEVTLAYSATAYWNFAKPKTFLETFEHTFINWVVSFALKYGVPWAQNYALQQLSYPVGTGMQTKLTYYIWKEDIESAGVLAGKTINTINEADVLAGIAYLQSETLQQVSYSLSFPSGQTVGEVGVAASPNKIDEAGQYVIADIGSLEVSAFCDAAIPETMAWAAGASVTGVGAVAWVVPGLLIAVSFLAGPVTDAWYYHQMSDPSGDYTQYVTLPMIPSIFSSLPSDSYTQLLYSEYEYYAYMNASVESSDRAYGALQANATYYALMQENYARDYAFNASSYLSEMVTELSAVRDQLNSTGCFNYTAFQQGQNILNSGLPSNVTDILEPLGIMPYVNTTSLLSTSYEEINCSTPVTLPDTASYFAYDAQLNENAILARARIVPDNYSTIQDAINNAVNGDTVFVRKGTYDENVIINKTISLIGEDESSTIIDGRNAGDTILVTANNVTVSGFTVINGEGGWPHGGINLEAENSIIIGNNASYNDGSGIITSFGGHNNSIFNNIATHNSAEGIRVDGSNSNAQVANNTIEHNHTDGIFLYVASNVLIENNVISSNDRFGITPQGGCGNITIRSNLVARSGSSGMSSNPLNSSLIEDNLFEGNGFAGIDLGAGSNNSLVIGNTLSHNAYGITLSGGSNSNEFYHNNFYGNTQQVYETGSYPNAWDNGYQGGGNYWSDYAGADVFSGPHQNQTGSDGIGDTAYVIDLNNTDNYPLMHPYGSISDLNTSLVYLTIQSAINAPETAEGDTVFVRDGTYYENVVVSKTLSLVGEGSESTIIDGGDVGQVVLVTADGVNVTGFTVRNNASSGLWAGIQLGNASNCAITGNNITNNGYGILLQYSSYDSISGNNITASNNDGIYFYSSSDNVVSGNNISANSNNGVELNASSSNNTLGSNNITVNSNNGIELDSSPRNSISANNLTANPDVGIDVENSSYTSMSSNIIVNNSACGLWIQSSSNCTLSANVLISDGLYVYDSYQNSVADNTVNGKPLAYLEGVSNYSVEDAGQVVLVDCDNITVENLNLSQASFGVILRQTNDSIISGNNITGNSEIGIWLGFYSNNNNSITGNNISDNAEGIGIRFSSNNTVSWNNIAANWNDGLWFDSSSGNVVSGNNISANSNNGVELNASSGNSISWNNISANTNSGIFIGSSSSNNNITGNNVTANNACGIWFNSSSNNSIYHNCFNNTVQVNSNQSTNIWDYGYPSGGNYWSTYNGTDFCHGPGQNVFGSDGIGDTPYVINAQNQDNYPLMTAGGSLTIGSSAGGGHNYVC